LIGLVALLDPKLQILLRFLSLLSDIKEFIQFRKEDTLLLEDTKWTHNLVFLTDILGNWTVWTV